jgi:4-hydroxy-tetrahydrodipicolinate synthase
MKEPLFSGVCTALVTPYLDGRINYPMLQQLIRRQIDAGIRDIVICGTTGEAPTLTDEEKLTMFHTAKEYVGNSCRIYAGTGSNNTAHAITLSQQAQELGVDGLLLVSPYYNKATPEGLYRHFAAIASSVQIPVILYNVPSRTGVDVPVAVYKRLSQISNVSGIKEASSDINKTLQIRAECPCDFAVWTGNDHHTTAAMALGAQGVISVVSNVCPEEMNSLARAALAGDFDTAAALQCSLLKLTDLMFCEVNPIPVKEAMRRIGYDCGGCRLPLCPLSESNRKKFDEFFQ